MVESNAFELFGQIGLEELAEAPDMVAADFLPASITGLSDGDLIGMHPRYTGRKAAWFGETRYSEGSVAQSMFRAALANGINPGVIYDFQTYASAEFVDSRYADQREESSVTIHPEAIVVDDARLALPRQPMLVADYGACLTGRSYIANQARIMARKMLPFAYLPLTRLHFTNATLLNTYDKTFGPNGAQFFTENRIYMGREDGVASAIDDVISAQHAHNAPTEVVDIALATGAQHTTRNELRHGIEHTHALLREAGILVVRSLARPAEAEIGTEEIVSWALEAGFDERNAVRHETRPGLGALHGTAGGHVSKRAMLTVILGK